MCLRPAKSPKASVPKIPTSTTTTKIRTSPNPTSPTFKDARTSPLPHSPWTGLTRPPSPRVSARGKRIVGAGARGDRLAGPLSLRTQNRDQDGDAIFRPHGSRDVTLAGQIFRQFDAAGPHLNRLSARQHELGVAAQRDHILAP